MTRETKNRVTLIVLLVILVLVIILAINVFKKDDKKDNKQSEGTSGIDMQDEAYAGMKIYEKNGETIIEDTNGGKTIETTKEKEKTSLVETTESDKEKYVLKDVKVSSSGGSTVITGNVTNNDSKKHNLIINVKFYSSENKIKGSASKKVEVKEKETQSFSMSTMDDVTQYSYKIQVEYAD